MQDQSTSGRPAPVATIEISPRLVRPVISGDAIERIAAELETFASDYDAADRLRLDGIYEWVSGMLAYLEIARECTCAVCPQDCEACQAPCSACGSCACGCRECGRVGNVARCADGCR